MSAQNDDLQAGMTVLDAYTEPIGQIHEVGDGQLVIQLQQAVTVPYEAIHAVQAQTVRLDQATDLLPLTIEEVRPAAHRGQVCAACGAIAGSATDGRYVRRGEAWFCRACWRGLASEAVRQVVQEVALQGVPSS